MIVIVVTELIIAQPALQLMLTDDIISHNITFGQAYPSADEENGIPTVQTAHQKKAMVKDDLSNKQIQTLFWILYRNDRGKALYLTIVVLLAGALIGFLIASIGFRHLLSLGDKLSRLSIMDILAIFVGGLIGIAIGSILLPFVMGQDGNQLTQSLLKVLVIFISIVLMMNMKEQLKLYFPSLARTQEVEKDYQKPKILDTNVIIDGRVSDVCNTGFIEGKIFVPSFVLDELQHIADSGDSMRRARGRRGLDILNQMRKDLGLEVRQCGPINPENPEEVDSRLVTLAKEIDGVIVTNDFNLNKVAQVQGVPVLNINELANALKPVVLPGEEMTVTIVKEGKEINQGIAYLDDGTMIVVEGARTHIGETCDIIVGSVLQTVAGKMIFANMKTNQEAEDALIDRNVRNYSNIRPRRKTF